MEKQMFGQREYKQSESKRAAVRERVRLHRQRNRQDPPGKLAKTWEENLSALDEATRNGLLERQQTVQLLTHEMSLVCQAVSKSRRAESASASIEGESIPDYLRRWKLPTFPDELYKEVREFNQRFPPIRSFAPVACAHYGVLNESFDDQNFAQFGLKTRIWELDWRCFVEAVLSWAEASPGDCDPAVEAEVKALCENWYPWKYATQDAAPAVPPPGLPVRTKAEERGALACRENREAAQRVFDESYGKHLIDRLNNGEDE